MCNNMRESFILGNQVSLQRRNSTLLVPIMEKSLIDLSYDEQSGAF